MSLLVSYRSRGDLICWQELEAARKLGVAVHVTLSREDARAAGFRQGRISDEMLREIIAGDYAGITFMTCGPKEIMDLTVRHTHAAGVPEVHMKQESFES